jgi:hypothetical protein
MLERSSRPPAEICPKLPTTGLLAITGGKVYSLLVNVSDVGSLKKGQSGHGSNSHALGQETTLAECLKKHFHGPARVAMIFRH